MLPGMFGALSDQTQRKIMLAGKIGQWTRGGVLFRSGEPAQTLYLLTKGNIRLYRLGHHSREVTIDVHAEGVLLGTEALLTQQQHSTFAEAMDECEALVITQNVLRQLLREAPDLTVVITRQIIRQTNTVQERFKGLVFLEVSQRLALALLELAEREGHWRENTPLPLRERVSHQDLAYTVGSTRETITKLLGEFRERGLLDLGYRRIVLLDKYGLHRVCTQKK